MTARRRLVRPTGPLADRKREEEALQAVEREHTETRGFGSPLPVCATCRQSWPCQSLLAVRGARAEAAEIVTRFAREWPETPEFIAALTAALGTDR
jgi:hypothetical protein